MIVLLQSCYYFPHSTLIGSVCWQRNTLDLTSNLLLMVMQNALSTSLTRWDWRDVVKKHKMDTRWAWGLGTHKNRGNAWAWKPIKAHLTRHSINSINLQVAVLNCGWLFSFTGYYHLRSNLTHLIQPSLATRWSNIYRELNLIMYRSNGTKKLLLTTIYFF